MLTGLWMFSKTLSLLGVTGADRGRAIRSASDAAERSSRWLRIEGSMQESVSDTGTQTRAWSTLAGSPGPCRMSEVKSPETPTIIPGCITDYISHFVHPRQGVCMTIFSSNSKCPCKQTSGTEKQSNLKVLEWKLHFTLKCFCLLKNWQQRQMVVVQYDKGSFF